MTKKKKIAPSLLLIYAVFLYPVIFGRISMACYLLVYGIPCIYIGINIHSVVKYIVKQSLFLFVSTVWFLICLVASVCFPLVHGTGDYSYVNVVLAMLRKAIIVIFLFLLTKKKLGKDNLLEHFMLYFSTAAACYVMGSIVFIIIPPLKSLWMIILHLDEHTLSLFDAYGYAARFGWSGFSGFRNTIDCSLAIVFLTYLFASKSSGLKLETSRYITLLLICFLGNMFYGRSGIIVSALCLVIGLLGYHKINFELLMRAVICLVAAFIVIYLLKSRVQILADWYDWATKPFIHLFTTGKFNNYSADHLMNDMIFMPGPKTFLFGDGYYTDPVTHAYYMSTDSGFMRQILFWGVGMTAITYIIWACSAFSIGRGVILMTMLLVLSIIFEIKGEVYYELLPLFTIITAIEGRQRKELIGSRSEYFEIAQTAISNKQET